MPTYLRTKPWDVVFAIHTPELWRRDAAGLCARVRACAGAGAA